jgi:hypothetical protein
MYGGSDPIDAGHGMAGQGYDGGHHGNYPGGAGGGGASGVGANGSGISGGNGGAGQWSLIESGYADYNVTSEGQKVYRGGGGGAYSGGTGGSGGGGNGYSTSQVTTSGGVNTGGGCGGNKTGQPNSRSVSGGSGIVILKIPDGNYSGTTTGSPTVTTVSSAEYGNVGNFKILKFTGGGSYTA